MLCLKFNFLNNSYQHVSKTGPQSQVIARSQRCKSDETGRLYIECCSNQGLRASSLQFTSPLEFNAIFCDGFPLRLDLNG